MNLITKSNKIRFSNLMPNIVYNIFEIVNIYLNYIVTHNLIYARIYLLYAICIQIKVKDFPFQI